jgi:hypothetical protein
MVDVFWVVAALWICVLLLKYVNVCFVAWQCVFVMVVSDEANIAEI